MGASSARPALLTQTSTPNSFSLMRLNIASMSSRTVKSHFIGRMLPRSDIHSVVRVWIQTYMKYTCCICLDLSLLKINSCTPTCSFSILLAQAATRIPCEANILAIALPDPMEAPVTKAARPSHFSMLNFCTGKWPDTHMSLWAFTCPVFWEDGPVSWSMCNVCCPVSRINSVGVTSSCWQSKCALHNSFR